MTDINQLVTEEVSDKTKHKLAGAVLGSKVAKTLYHELESKPAKKGASIVKYSKNNNLHFFFTNTTLALNNLIASVYITDIEAKIPKLEEL